MTTGLSMLASDGDGAATGSEGVRYGDPAATASSRACVDGAARGRRPRARRVSDRLTRIRRICDGGSGSSGTTGAAAAAAGAGLLRLWRPRGVEPDP